MESRAPDSPGTAATPPDGVEPGPRPRYQVIARRYRPRTFEEVVGQEAAASTLRNAILQDRLAHAFLFTGPRGVGKTSMARIFAKALNCPRAADRSRPREEWGIPCDECDVCRAIHAGEDIDVMEMDGASYRGIEEIRDIVENVKFTPSRSPFKIFIIDEVHMLTREAFNALLKTLEEPPGHVKFIFATTEPHKVLDTVLSRCQRFDFRPIREEDIVNRLAQICRAEGVTAEPELLVKIARFGKGGLRDAQTLLDQAITFCDGELKSADLERITGRLPEASVDAVVEAVDARKTPETFRALAECFSRGADPAVLLDQVIERVHDRLVGLLERAGEGGSPGPDPAAIDLLLARLQVLNDTAGKLRGAPYPRLAVELAMMKLARMEDPRALEEILGYLKSVEERLGSAGPSAMPAAPPAHGPPRMAAARPVAPSAPPLPPAAPTVPSSAPQPPRTAQAPAAPAAPPEAPEPPPRISQEPPAEKPEFSRLSALWSQVLIEAGEKFPKIKALLGRSPRFRESSRAGTFTVLLESEFNLKQLRDAQRVRDFETLVREVTGSPWRVVFELEPLPEGGVPGSEGRGPAAAPPGAKPPAGRNGPALRDDPLVKKSLDLFKGKIV
jgi:DNA polymerase III subunit gamma/tau